MILDSIQNCEKYSCVHKVFSRVFDLLKIMDEHATGTTVLEEGAVWANVIEVGDIAGGNQFFEAHRKFIDIHYILSGEELFGYSNIDCLETKQEYVDADDYELLTGEINAIRLQKGDFIVTFPEDAHIPDLARTNNNKLVRVVVKVRI